MMSFDQPEDRYRRDATFRTLVDMLEIQIERAQYTPTELREAAILAATHYELRRPRNHFVALSITGQSPIRCKKGHTHHLSIMAAAACDND